MPPKTALRLTEPGETLSPMQQIAQALHLIATALERLEPSTSSQLLTGAEVLARYGLGPAALNNRGVPRVKCGRSFRWRISDIESALTAQPVRPRPAKGLKVGDELEQLVASGRARR